MAHNIGIIQLVKLVASAVLAAFSCVLFILVMIYKLAEAFFQIMFSRKRPQSEITEIINLDPLK